MISKICAAIVIEETGEMKLFNGKGSIIPDQPITVRDKKVNWSLGSFLLKRHASAEKITLGVGSIESALGKEKEGQKTTKSMDSVVLICLLPFH